VTKRKKPLITFWCLAFLRNNSGSISYGKPISRIYPHNQALTPSWCGGERRLSSLHDCSGEDLTPWSSWALGHCGNIETAVFDGIAPSLVAGLAQADEDRKMWELAGAKGISFLMAQLSGGEGFRTGSFFSEKNWCVCKSGG
jgi:hypothetical protein